MRSITTARWARIAAIAPLILLPFLLRAAYAIETLGADYLRWNMLVGYVNHTLAADIARGLGAPYELFRSPWYAVGLSLVYRIAGEDPLAARSIQWLMGACTCLLVYCVARTLFGRSTGLVALALAALYAPAIFLEGDLVEQAAAAFFATAGVALIARTVTRGGGAAIALPAGVAHGIASILRPDLILAAPLIAAAAACAPALAPADGRPPRPATAAARALRATLFGAGCLIACAPLIAPRIFLDVAASRLDLNLAINLYLGNNAQADGLDPRFPETPEIDTTDPEATRRHMTGLDLAGIRYAMGTTGGDIGTVAGFWLERTRRFVTDHPGRFAALEARKVLLFLGGHIHNNQKDIYFAREFSRVLRWMVFCAGICFPLGLVIPLAVVGSLSGGSRAGRILLLALPIGCLATTLLFFHDQRFQHPAVPAILVLAARGATALGSAARARRWQPWALVAAAAFLSNADLPGAHRDRTAAEWFRIGTMHQDRAQITGAFHAYARSVRSDPGHVPALDNLVYLSMTTGRSAEAIDLLEEIDRAGRSTAPLLSSLIRLHAGAGRRDAVDRLAARALRDYPQAPEVHAAVADALVAAGRLEEAEAAFGRGLRIHPGDALLALGMCDVLARQGRCGEAVPWCDQVIASGSPYPQAYALAGSCLSATGGFGRAADLLARGTALYPDDLALRGLLCRARDGIGRIEEAQDCYRSILAAAPDDRETLWRLAISLASQGRNAEALPHARRARDLGHPEAGALVLRLEAPGAR